jgi:uncharacterized protein (DUF2132 family)
MSQEQPNNPLHGITLKALLEVLVDRYGWDELGYRVNIRCFTSNPSIKSSLKFLRKTDWAREKVERLYIADQHRLAKNQARNRRRAARRAYRASLEE